MGGAAGNTATSAPGPAPAPPVRVGPSSGGASTPSTVTVSPAPEPGQITPTWEKPFVIPLHNGAFPPSTPPTDGTIPDDAKAKLAVATTGIPDGTAATISVRHCETNASVFEISGLEVRSNQVVDATSGQPPVFTFPVGTNPWSLWDKPFFYFRVTINGRSVDSEKDYHAHAAQCLRVKLFVQCVSDSKTPDILHQALPEATGVQSIVNGVPGAQALLQDITITIRDVKVNASLFRNAYAVHIACHGDCITRGHGFSIQRGTDPPPLDVENPAGWSAIVAASEDLDYADADVSNGTTTPSVPTVLFYGSCCLTGYVPSFADAMIARGCRNLILFRMSIPDSEAPVFANQFWNAWAGFHFDPEKIHDCFFRNAGDHYDTMRPVLYGSGGARASGGLSAGAIAGIVIGSLVGAALIGVGIWALSTNQFGPHHPTGH